MKNFNLKRKKKGKGKLEAESKRGHPKHKSVLYTLYQHIQQQSVEVPCTYDFQFSVENDIVKFCTCTILASLPSILSDSSVPQFNISQLVCNQYSKKVRSYYPHKRPWLAQGEITGIGLLILNFIARWRWVVNTKPQLLYPEHTTQYAGWAQGQSGWVWRREYFLFPLQFQSKLKKTGINFIAKLHI
jgi:hypothetical protein